MNDNADWRYLVGTAFFLVAWLLLYWRAPLARKVMLWSSVWIMWTAPVFESINQDYWHPEFCVEFKLGWLRFGPESFLLAFSVIGLATGVFDVVYRRASGPDRRGHLAVPAVTWRSYVRLAWSGGLAAAVIVGLTYGLGMNSVHAHIVACAVLAAGVMWRIRFQWKLPSLAAGAALAVIMAAFYFAYFLPLFPTVIRDWWKLEVMWGVNLGGVPVEEFVWACTNALYLGPVARYCLDGTLRDPIQPWWRQWVHPPPIRD